MPTIQYGPNLKLNNRQVPGTARECFTTMGFYKSRRWKKRMQVSTPFQPLMRRAQPRPTLRLTSFIRQGRYIEFYYHTSFSLAFDIFTPECEPRFSFTKVIMWQGRFVLRRRFVFKSRRDARRQKGIMAIKRIIYFCPYSNHQRTP